MIGGLLSAAVRHMVELNQLAAIEQELARRLWWRECQIHRLGTHYKVGPWSWHWK